MAFINKLGNLLKQSAVKHINKELSASMPSIYQAIRSMSSSKLFVGGVSYSTDDLSLREAFARYGEIIDAKVIMDRETGRSRGFAFITFASSEDASSAIQAMDGQDLHGRRIRVNYATERSRPGFGGGGFYSSGGGYAGNNYGGDRAGSYGHSGYGPRGSYGSSSENFGVSDGASGGSNYQFNQNSGGDVGFGSGEFSNNSSLGSDDIQFSGSKDEGADLDDGLRENNDEPDDYAQTQK